ncbi:MAG: hypothetical protein U9Q06_03935 [Nanoarchaeota archaeon]|nr:hypothetical protein [Nanoarchaeota archaeon]
MESKTGSLLAKISAIINLVLAIFIFLIGICLTIIAGMGIGESSGNVSPFGISMIILAITLFISGIMLTLSLLLFSASTKMKNPKTVKNGAIWSLVLGIITFGNLSGILALVGGIIGLSDADK